MSKRSFERRYGILKGMTKEVLKVAHKAQKRNSDQEIVVYVLDPRDQLGEELIRAWERSCFECGDPRNADRSGFVLAPAVFSPEFCSQLAGSDRKEVAEWIRQSRARVSGRDAFRVMLITEGSIFLAVVGREGG